MRTKKVSRFDEKNYSRMATDIATALAAKLGSDRDKPSSKARYLAVIEAWDAVKHFPIYNYTLRNIIAHAFGFSSGISVWRIIASRSEQVTGQSHRKSLGGYDRTWEKIESKASA